MKLLRLHQFFIVVFISLETYEVVCVHGCHFSETILSKASNTDSVRNYESSVYPLKPRMFVSRCIQNAPFDIDYFRGFTTYSILSLCRFPSYGNFRSPDEGPKQVSHFSPHSFLIVFHNIWYRDDHGIQFQRFYEKLVIPASQYPIFDFIGANFHEYPQYNSETVKMELLRNRWNKDQFIVLNSHGALYLLVSDGCQLPTSLQKFDERYSTNNVSDMALFYYITSGYLQQCTHSDRYDKLKSLTLNFAAYDRLFCDAWEYHGLESRFKAYWNLGDMIFFRGMLVRDGLVSAHPPDTSNAVFYASPKLVFAVLRRSPVTWFFTIRPFQNSLWYFVFFKFFIIELARLLKLSISYYEKLRLKLKIIQPHMFHLVMSTVYATKLRNVLIRYSNTLTTLSGCLRITLSSAYNGMILVCILNPRFAWIPETFKDLNNTDNYYVGIAAYSPYFIKTHLLERFQLNKLHSKEMIDNRRYDTPAAYLTESVSESFAKSRINRSRHYSVITYDDKVNLWIKGRGFLEATAPFLHRIKLSSEGVLPEMRYVSVAPGSTRLHFIMTTIKRAFTSGTWMRWYYLEQNYYKIVAPTIAANILDSRQLPKAEVGSTRRPLKIHDLFSVFVIQVAALVICILSFMFELYTKCAS